MRVLKKGKVMINSFLKKHSSIQTYIKILVFLTAFLSVIGPSFINGSLLFWALVFIVVVYNLLLIGSDYKKYIKDNKYEMLFIIICLLSSLINYKYNNIYSYVKILETAILIFAFVPITPNFTKSDYEKERNIISNLLIGFTFVIVCFSLISSLIKNPSELVTLLKGARYGGIYENANQGGFWALISIIFSYFKIKENKYLKFNVLNILLQFFLLVVSGCRSAYVAFFILITYMLFTKIKKYKNYKIVMIAIVSFFALIIIAITLIRYQWIGQYVVDNPERAINLLSGLRYFIWNDAVKLTSKFPVFGVGVNNLNAAANALLPEGSYYIIGNWEDPHNIIICLLGYTGVVGLVSFLAILINKAKQAMKNNLTELIVIAIALFTISIFDIAIIFDGRIVSIAFWYFIGRITYESIKV